MNLAPREGLADLVGTPANVAPNTYNVSYPCCKYRTTNYAPFLTFSKRAPIKSTTYTHALYDPPAIRSKIKYGNSLQFTAPRVTIDVNEEPPPKKEVIRKPYIIRPRKKGNSGKLYAFRVPFTVGVSAPTIPGHSNCNGYDINEDDELIKLPPPDYDTTLGPAYYDVPPGELCFNSRKYKGCRWSKMKGQRTKLAANDNPGPSDYDVKFITCPKHKEDEKFKELMRKCCNVPRYTCQLICQSINEGRPGPGDYEIVDIDKLGALKNCRLRQQPPPERFVYKAGVGPGPQTYLVCDCYKHKKDFSIKKDVPFLGDALRFPVRKVASTPGPGDYEVTGGKCNRYQGFKRSFNSTAVRKLLEAANDYPAPGDYDVPVKGVTCCPQEPRNRTSVFSSMTCRFPRSKKQDQPDAASYSITQAFKYNNARRSHATGRHVAFGASEEKFARIYDFAGTSPGNDTPSIGKYNLPQLPKSNGKTIPYAERFPTLSYEKRPGPQTYSFHPAVGDALYKGVSTYNARLKKHVVKRAKLLNKDPRKRPSAHKKAQTSIQEEDSFEQL